MYALCMSYNYRSVSIPEELVEKARKLIIEQRLGYRSVSEFIIDALRRRIEELEKKEVNA